MKIRRVSWCVLAALIWSWCNQNSSEQSCDRVLFHSISVPKIKRTPNSKWSSLLEYSEEFHQGLRRLHAPLPRKPWRRGWCKCLNEFYQTGLPPPPPPPEIIKYCCLVDIGLACYCGVKKFIYLCLVHCPGCCDKNTRLFLFLIWM